MHLNPKKYFQESVLLATLSLLPVTEIKEVRILGKSNPSREPHWSEQKQGFSPEQRVSSQEKQPGNPPVVLSISNCPAGKKATCPPPYLLSGKSNQTMCEYCYPQVGYHLTNGRILRAGAGTN